jgi:hypothetical protein
VNQVRILGPRQALLGLHSIPGVSLNRHAVELPDGRLSVSGFADDAAIPEIEAAGCTVAVVNTEAQLQEKREIAFRQVEGNDSFPA